ncbi:MAG: hypothetical protein AAGJ18_13840 [Bacteroidota bacterium]
MYLYHYIAIFLFLFNGQLLLFAQSTVPYINQQNLSKHQFDSVYQSIMHQQYEEYLTWQKQLPVWQKARIRKSITRGVLWGVFVGGAVGAFTSDYLVRNPNVQYPIFGGLIGGLLGFNLGRWVGIKKSERGKFYFHGN